MSDVSNVSNVQDVLEQINGKFNEFDGEQFEQINSFLYNNCRHENISDEYEFCKSVLHEEQESKKLKEKYTNIVLKVKEGDNQ